MFVQCGGNGNADLIIFGVYGGWFSLGAVERRATLAFPVLRFVIRVLDADTAVSAGGWHLNCFTWYASKALVLTAWWTRP